NMSLIAVGGYGRQELFPFSDIDFLILHNDIITSQIEKLISQFITACWDLGLKIGHSVRDLSEVKKEFNADITTATNLTESRLICGSNKLFVKMQAVIDKTISIKKYYKEKNKEQLRRHNKYRASAYQLEPNIKESPGGLRDLHMIRWISISQKKGSTFYEMYQNKIIDKAELIKIKYHENKINKRRIMLHILSNSVDDRLVFDLQNKLALALGYTNKNYIKSSEIVMKSYYKSVRYVTLFNEIIIKRLDPNIKTKQCLNHKLPFFVSNNLIELDKPHLKKIKPYIFDAFLLFQKNKRINGFGANLLGALNTMSFEINEDFRKDKRNQELFLKILQEKNKVNRSLRLMNKCNILGKFIPAFGRIVAQMQHDLFHIYTVDEHTLNVVENIRRFSKAELKDEFPDCFEIFRLFKKPHVLYLGAIFHDIAKGKGGNHSELGTIIADRFCKKMFLSQEDTYIIQWLVKSHLKMSEISQKKDISNPNVINDFKHYVGNQYRLDALYLLTVADIRGTSPHVWNQWKATLLKDLYATTKKALSEENKTIEQTIDERKQLSKEILSKDSIENNHYKTLWEKLGNDYFLRFDEQEIAWQTKLLIPHIAAKEPIVKVQHNRDGNGIKVLIYTKDNDSLFVKLASFFYKIGSEVVQAKVYTTKHNYALDVFNILDEPNPNVNYKKFFTYIESELIKRLKKNLVNDIKIETKKTRQAIHHEIGTNIIYKSVNNKQFELQVITDSRPGLLILIVNEINLLGLSISNAKINTLGQRAEDFFIINSNNKTISKQNIKKLIDNIKVKLLAFDG
ncbi:MAG: [protein-PII] uridylyltransferase, partial [Methylophilaceae bacterium]